MNDGKHISQEDLTLYAMRALPEDEAAAVRVHVAECAECREELAAISGDLALVALSVEQHAVPEGARQRFMDRLSATAQPDALREQVAQKSSAQVVAIDAPRARRSTTWIAWSALAASVVVAVGLGVQVHSLNQQLQAATELVAAQAAANARAQEVLDVLTASTAQHVVLAAAHAKPEPTARAVYLASRGALILEASNLAPLASDKTYELWVIPASGAAPVPAGLFKPDATGSASLVLPQLPKGVAAKAFGVTIEKAGGAGTPTAPIILSGAAPATGE
jgi:hypothetical protein